MLNNIVSLLGDGVAASTNSYESIATFALTSNTATVTFSSIPQTYKHLQIRIYGKSQGTTNPTDSLQLSFNGSSTSGDYASHYVKGNGSAASAGARTTWGDGLVDMIGRNGNWGSCVVDVLDYTSTNKNLTVRGIGGADANGSGVVSLASVLWHPSTLAAVTSITLDPNGNTWSSGSKIALYGVKG